MTALVGIHGIWRQQLGRQQLLAEWGPALGDGLERAAGRRIRQIGLDIAYYGHLFLAGATGKSTMDGSDLLANLSSDEVADLTAAVLEVDPHADLDVDEVKGVPAFPLAIQRLIRAVDRRFRVPVGALVLGELRQVRRYLCESSLKATVDAVVADSVVAASPRVLIGHSLGTVVALEYVRQHPDTELDLLLTLGSPLALRMVRRHLPDASFGVAGGKPTTVGRWINVYDEHDPVAAAGGLAPIWTAVDDRLVDNEFDAHNVRRYLSKKATGEAIVTIMPELIA